MAENTGISWTDHTCLDPETPVLMNDGSQRIIANLTVGDQVAGFPEKTKGRNKVLEVADVQAVWETHCNDALELSFASGRILVCSPEHKWLTKTEPNGKRGVWKEARKLTIETSIYSFGASESDQVSVPEDNEFLAGYFAGATAGDGTMRFDPEWCSNKKGYPQMYWRIAVSESDYPLLERVRTCLRQNGIDSEIKGFNGSSGKKGMIKLEHRAKSDLLVIRKLLEKRESSRNWIAGWLAGFNDTDGWFSGTLKSGGISRRWSQVITRNDYLQDTQNYLSRLGFEFELEVREQRASSVRLKTNGIHDHVRYIQACPSALDRKGISRLYGCRLQAPLDQIVGIRRIGPRKMINITTSTRTFIANGLLTHNCYAAAQNGRAL